MKLSQYRADYYFFSGRTSELVRQFAFAGIALVWIFKTGPADFYKIPEKMIYAAGFMAACLMADLLHYVWSTFIWGNFHWRTERKLLREQASDKDPDIGAPRWFNRPALFFFCSKIILLAVGYTFIGIYIVGKLL
ncbi:MAG TPA: hypothetical protein PLG94_15920 [Smithellaceae bacterium]|nr:hypothetical protein [Smithellaceae bacterium]